MGGGVGGGREQRRGVWGEDLEGGACSDNLYTSGPRPRRIFFAAALKPILRVRTL